MRPLNWIVFVALVVTAQPVRAAVWSEWSRRDRKVGVESATRSPVDEDFRPNPDPGWVPGMQKWTRLDGKTRFGYGIGGALNRVDGFSLLAAQTIQSRGTGIDFSSYQGYGLAAAEWSGAFEVAFHPGTRAVAIGGRWADETMAWLLPRQALTAEESFLAAFVTRLDYADYLRRRGEAAFARWSTDRSGIGVTYYDETHSSLRRRVAQFGLFGGNRSFRPNPNIEPGEWHRLELRGFWAAEERSLSGEDAGPAVFVDAQWAGGSLGGERGFTRFWAEHRGDVRLSRAQHVRYRVSGGVTPQGNVDDTGSMLPPQWQFQAGGIGSLRGHRYQEYRGDRMVLGTVEYGLDLDSNVEPVMFVDGGKAWNESNRETGGIGGSGVLALDGGLGLLLGSDGIRIDLARDLRAQRAPARVTLRLSHAF